jgi:cytoskeleton protein RodZ
MTLERPMADLGSKLRQAREKKGVSIRQVSTNTKIGAAVLEGLERNDISKLPTGIFGRAFVRSFAAEVGLDPEVALQEFTEQFRGDLATVTHVPTEGVDDHEARERRTQRRRRTLIVGVAVVLLAVGAVSYFGIEHLQSLWAMALSRTQSSKVVDTTPAEPAPAPADAAPAPVQTEPASDAAAAPPVSATAGGEARSENERPSSDAPADRLNVVLKVTRSCWVAATVDGKKQFQRVLKPGDDRALEVQNDLVLTVGDAGAVKMTINGMEAKSLGRSGEVVTDRLTLSNMKRFLASH